MPFHPKRTPIRAGLQLVLAAAACLFTTQRADAQGDPLPRGPTKPNIQPPSIPAPGQRSPGQKSGDQLVKMQMTADVERIKPNEKFLLAFVFDLEPHWHIYWENAGASGAPTDIKVKAPQGFVIGKTLFPRPQIIESPEGACYGYETRVILFVEVTAPATSMPLLNFTADASWLVCKDICKMGSASAMLALPFGETAVPGAQPVEIHPDVAKFKARLPKPVVGTSSASIDFDGKVLTINLPGDGTPVSQFFPNPSPGVEFGEPKVESHDSQVRTIVPVTLTPNNAMGKPMRLAGVVGLGRGLDDPCFAFDLLLNDEGRPQQN